MVQSLIQSVKNLFSTEDSPEGETITEPKLVPTDTYMDTDDTPDFLLFIPQKTRGVYKIPISNSDIPDSLDPDEPPQIFGDGRPHLEGMSLGTTGFLNERCHCCKDDKKADTLTMETFRSPTNIPLEYNESQTSSVKLCSDCLNYLDTTAIELLTEHHPEYLVTQNI